MLQQTQVAHGDSLQALSNASARGARLSPPAAAPTDEVLRLWAGPQATTPAPATCIELRRAIVNEHCR